MTPKPLYFRSRHAWRSWLGCNHAKAKEVWLLFYKKHTQKPCVAYTEAVEEALCFGWIDTKVLGIDGEKFKQKYTPRNPKSVWSLLNKKREGRMTKFGMRKINAAKKTGRWASAYTLRTRVVLSPDLRKALKENERAWRMFKHFAPGYRNHYISWVKEAKSKETRARRIAEVVKRVALDKKPGVP